MAFHSRCNNVVAEIPSALLLFMMLLMAFPFPSHAHIPKEVAQQINSINDNGEYYGLIVVGNAEIQALTGNGGLFQPDADLPTVDASARRFRVGKIGKHRTILVMCGSVMMNAGLTAQLLVTLFRVRAVLICGRASGPNPNKHNIGDVVIPRQFAHAGIFHWENYGGDNIDIHRDIANLKFSKYNVGEKNVANELETVCFQPEDIYSPGKPEEGKETFWMGVDDHLYEIAQKIENVELERCLLRPLRCLSHQPKIKRVEKGSSSNMFVNNKAYADFLRDNLEIDTIDHSSAAIAMACKSENTPFLALRSIIDYGGVSDGGNDVNVIHRLWVINAVSVVRELFNRLPSLDPQIRSDSDG